MDVAIFKNPNKHHVTMINHRCNRHEYTSNRQSNYDIERLEHNYGLTVELDMLLD